LLVLGIFCYFKYKSVSLDNRVDP